MDGPRPTRLARTGVAVVATLLAACTGCTVGATPPVALAPTAGSASPTGSEASPAPSAPPTGTQPILECLNRSYHLTRFTATDPAATYASGSGGDVVLSFTGEQFPDGNFVDTFYRVRAGRTPIRLRSADGAATLRLTASGQGAYTLKSGQNPQNSDAIFAARTSTGSGRLTRGSTTTTVSAAAGLALVSPSGASSVTCTRTTLTLGAENATFVMTRV